MKTFTVSNKKAKDYLVDLCNFNNHLKQFPLALENEIEGWNKKAGREIKFIRPPGRAIVFSTYFTSKKDPQRNLFVQSEDFNYFREWYESVMNLGMSAVVFTDSTNPNFLKKYSNNQVAFLQCKLGNLSVNDERFFLYYTYLMKFEKEIDSVFMTDINDVLFIKNPFQLISNNEDIFVGRNNTNLMIHSRINMERIRILSAEHDLKFSGDFFAHPIYNAGIIGGSKVVILFFLNKICETFNNYPCNANMNMLTLNMVLYKYFVPNSVTKCSYRYLLSFLSDRQVLLIERIKRFLKGVSWDRFISVDSSDSIGNARFIKTSYPLHNQYKTFIYSSDHFIKHK